MFASIIYVLISMPAMTASPSPSQVVPIANLSKWADYIPAPGVPSKRIGALSFSKPLRYSVHSFDLELSSARFSKKYVSPMKGLAFSRTKCGFMASILAIFNISGSLSFEIAAASNFKTNVFASGFRVTF